jgi:hypothetical protein
MENLPNDIIMRIIREADGGRHTHKTKFLSCLGAIEEVGSYYGDESLQGALFIYCLLDCETLSESVYRRICRENDVDIH